MAIEVAITDDGRSAQQLYRALQQDPELRRQLEQAGVELRVEAPAAGKRMFGLDTAVLVALIAGGSPVLAALVQALSKTFEKSEAGKIVIQGADGARVEFPADTPKEEQERLIAAAGALHRPRIELVSG